MIIYVIEPGTYIKKNGEKINIICNDIVKESIPINIISSVVLSGKVIVSNGVFESFLKKEISLYWVNNQNKYIGKLDNISNINIEREYRQYKLMEDNLKTLEISKKIIYGKAKNQNEILKRYTRNFDSVEIKNIIKEIEININKIKYAKNTMELMGIEGYISKQYFKAMRYLIPDEYDFHKRIKQNPTDSVNATLNFCYSLLFNDIHNAIRANGLNPYIPILHSLKNRHQALVSDLMEEWRPILIDSMVINMFKNRELKIHDFEFKDDYCVISDNAIKKIVSKYRKKIDSSHKFVKDDKNGQTYIQSINNQVRIFKNIVELEKEEYVPVIVR